MISNCTGRPVFCWITVAQFRRDPPLTRSPIRILTRLHPRSLLSIARSNRTRSRIRLCSSREKRISQMSRGLNGRFGPTSWPAFHGRHSCTAGSRPECPILLLQWPKWPTEEIRLLQTKGSWPKPNDRGGVESGKAGLRRKSCKTDNNFAVGGYCSRRVKATTRRQARQTGRRNPAGARLARREAQSGPAEPGCRLPAGLCR